MINGTRTVYIPSFNLDNTFWGLVLSHINVKDSQLKLFISSIICGVNLSCFVPDEKRGKVTWWSAPCFHQPNQAASLYQVNSNWSWPSSTWYFKFNFASVPLGAAWQRNPTRTQILIQNQFLTKTKFWALLDLWPNFD